MLARRRRAFCRWPPATATGGANLQTVAGMQFDADFLGAQLARRTPFRQQAIAMRHAVLAAEHAAGPVAHAFARGVAERGLFRLQHHVEGDAEPAAELPVAAGAGTEFVLAEVERKSHFGDFDAAEFQSAHAMPLADRGIAVTAGGCAAAGTGLEHVPDEIAAVAR